MKSEFDKKAEVLKILEACQHKFRYAPTNKYLVEVADLLAKISNIKDITTYCDRLPFKHHTFPDLKTIEQEIRTMRAVNLYGSAPEKKKPVEAPWVSKQAAGTHAKAEALFNMIKKGRTAGHGFTLARNGAWAKHLTDEQLWSCYEDWCNGKVHPLLEEDVFKC